MKALDEVRKTEVLIEGNWVRAHWEQLEVGDVFRLIELDGSVHVGSYFQTQFTVLELPAIRIHDRMTMQSETNNLTTEGIK